MSSDSEYEEEEILVFADFNNQLMPQELGDISTAIKLIGIETDNPIAEINGNLFKGSYDYAMGTNVFFEKDLDAPAGDPLFEPTCKQKWKYFAKTTKVINFQRMFVEPNKDAQNDETTDIDDNMPSTSSAAAAAERLRKEKVAEDAGVRSVKTSMTYEEAVKTFPTVAELQWRENNETR